MDLTLNPRRVLRVLLVAIALLTLANVCVVLSVHVLGHRRLFGLVRLFDVDREANLPSLFSALQLAFTALVLTAIGRGARSAGDRFSTHWLGLAILFGYLALDEGVALHEEVGEIMRAQFVLSGIWFYAWYIPYAGLALGLAVAYRRFVWHLPRAVRTRFAVAGAVFLAGAVGIEMVESYLWSLSASDAAARGWRTALAYSVEEPLEMVGVALFAYAALLHAADQRAGIRIVFAPAARSMPREERKSTPLPDARTRPLPPG